MPEEFERPATDEAIENMAAALTANNIEAVVLANGEEARRRVLELVPEGAEIQWAKSKTLEDLGLDKVWGAEMSSGDPGLDVVLGQQTAEPGSSVNGVPVSVHVEFS